jgi:hypothetical protein
MRPLVTRAPRYDLRLPVAVRAEGDGAWHDGLIANASRTGVLFVADVSWPPETSIELCFRLGRGPRDAAPVVCTGVVVRSTAASAPGRRAATAARISAYRFAGHTDAEAVQAGN